MTIHDICITTMQQQDIEANAGEIAYTIKVHGLKGDDDNNQIEDENIVIREGMTIKELKGYILSITGQPFFLKFHMNNNEKLQDLINKTRDWNTQRNISNDDGMLVFDVYLDTNNFDLHMEVDLEKEKMDKINVDDVQGFKYLTVKNVSGNTSLEKFF